MSEPHADYVTWDKVAAAICLILPFLLWLASFFPKSRLWGINHWAYYPFWLRTAVIVSALVIFIPRVQQKLVVFLKPPLIRFFGIFTESRKVWSYLSIAIISLLIFYLFRTKTHFLGDGYHILDSIRTGSLTPNWSQPLSIWISLGLYRLLFPALNLDGASVYALVSYIAGIIFVIFALKLANFLGKSPSTRLFIFLMLILMGSGELFFGYAEHYPLLCSGILIYLFYSLKYLRGKTKVFVPVMIFLILLPTHFSSMYLLPSVSYLLVSCPEEKISTHPLKAKKLWMVLLFVLIICVCSVLYVRNSDRFVLGHVMPILHGGYAGPHYALFSPDHIIDFLNQQFLSSPIGFALCLILLIIKPGYLALKDRTFKFLLTVGLAQLVFNFIINPGLGAARDWDLFASVGLGYTVLALYIFSRVEPAAKLSRLKFNLTVAALLFTLPWILINASPDKSVARFRNLLDLDPRRSRNGHFVLAVYFNRLGKPEERDNENRKIMEKFPELKLYDLGKTLLEQGDLSQAYQKFTQSLQISPDCAEAHAGLGWYYSLSGDFKKSETEYKKALELKPDLQTVYSDLGDVYMKKLDFKNAERMYNHALKHGVDDPRIYNNLGILYVQLSQLDQAASFYQKAINMQKNSSESRSGLAYIYSQQGEFQEALAELDLLLQTDPNFAMAYYQLGSVYQSLGRKKEALEAYSRYLKTQPNDPKAVQVKQLMEGLGAE